MSESTRIRGRVSESVGWGAGHSELSESAFRRDSALAKSIGHGQRRHHEVEVKATSGMDAEQIREGSTVK